MGDRQHFNILKQPGYPFTSESAESMSKLKLPLLPLPPEP